MDKTAFIAFLTLNLIGTIIYLIVGMTGDKTYRKLVIFRCVVFLLAPGVGPLFVILGWLGYKIAFKTDVDLSDVVFSKDRGPEFIRTNEEKDRNVVPLEEAIEVMDNADLRQLFMNVAQGDYQDSLASIALALNCNDTETAHYAASVLQDALNNFRFRVQAGFNKITDGEGDLEKEVTDLLYFMNKVLVQKVFGNMEQKSFVDTMEKAAGILYDEKPDSFSADLFEMVCLRLLEVEEYEKCELWCNRQSEMFPGVLSSYTCKLKLFFNSERRDEFFETLNELKASSVIVDRNTLELIRTFQ